MVEQQAYGPHTRTRVHTHTHLHSSEASCCASPPSAVPAAVPWTHLFSRGFPKQRILELNEKIRRVGEIGALKQRR